jgi:uncharacterized membrane protein
LISVEERGEWQNNIVDAHQRFDGSESSEAIIAIDVSRTNKYLVVEHFVVVVVVVVAFAFSRYEYHAANHRQRQQQQATTTTTGRNVHQRVAFERLWLS